MKLKSLIEELMLEPEKVILLETKRLAAQRQINVSITLQQEAQILLDKAACQVQRKIKTFQTLDVVLAEFKFAVRRQEDAKKKDAKRQKKIGKTPKTAEQAIADVMACLENLPEEQRKAVLATMQAQQNQEV